MNPLLEQFILEGRDFLQNISDKLMQLEDTPDDKEVLTELFRSVHTLKGNSGLFDFPEMTHVLHAGEDLMDSVREGMIPYSQELADQLLDAMDFVNYLMDEIEKSGEGYSEADISAGPDLEAGLRALIPAAEGAEEEEEENNLEVKPLGESLLQVPEDKRLEAFKLGIQGDPLCWISYHPAEDSFFKGEDPFYQVRHIQGFLWADVAVRGHGWGDFAELDCYQCVLDFFILSEASKAELMEYFRYMPLEVVIESVSPIALILPEGKSADEPVAETFITEALAFIDEKDVLSLQTAVHILIELSAPELLITSILRWLLVVIEKGPTEFEVMRRLVMALKEGVKPNFEDLISEPSGAVETDAVVATDAGPESELSVEEPSTGEEIPANDEIPGEAEVIVEDKGNTDTVEGGEVLSDTENIPVLSTEARQQVLDILGLQADILALPGKIKWFSGRLKAASNSVKACLIDLGEPYEAMEALAETALESGETTLLAEWLTDFIENLNAEPELEPKPEPELVKKVEKVEAVPQKSVAKAKPARSEDGHVNKVLKVDQNKIDRLMNLIGEMVVAKNSLPYLANRAENQFAVPELSREIKAQYGVINRIAEEMQDAILQVRMMPVSFVFQRFPRLVRDISRKLDKSVELVIEGEETEADKNIIEGLADPLIHIVRNSLDHGLETPEVRKAAGKPPKGKLTISAMQESDRVVIQIVDDGKGIDAVAIKSKAYEKGLIDEAQFERMTEQESVNLVFMAGFSTAEVVSDLSGRGVGMDVVRNSIDKVGGTVELTSHLGRGTTLKISLPLSLSVTNVMIFESDQQLFGIPMDSIVETVRLPSSAIKIIKHQKTIVLRGRILPLLALNDLLEISAEPQLNSNDEFAVMVVRICGEQAGLLVDDFHEVIDVILKPLLGDLSKLSCYAGTALLGDGTVLMILNPKELM